jgi:hypothetical protein
MQGHGPGDAAHGPQDPQVVGLLRIRLGIHGDERSSIN